MRETGASACAGNAGNVSPPPTSKETASKRSRHASRHVRYARAMLHVGIAYPRGRGKRSRHSRCMRNPQFYASVKRPIAPTFKAKSYRLILIVNSIVFIGIWIRFHVAITGCYGNVNQLSNCESIIKQHKKRNTAEQSWLSGRIRVRMIAMLKQSLRVYNCKQTGKHLLQLIR